MVDSCMSGLPGKFTRVLNQDKTVKEKMKRWRSL